MSHIIVVFPRRDNAVNIRNVLVRAGMEVSAVCQYSGNASAVTGKRKKEAERKKPEKK